MTRYDTAWIDAMLSPERARETDPFGLLRWAGLLHTSNQVDYRDWPSALQVLRMGTIESARACGLADEVGSLEAGKRADLVLLTRDSYHLAADNNLPVQLVYCENGTSIQRVIVNGETVTFRIVVKDNGAGVKGIDADRIFDPYYRSGAATAKPDSVGLGLSVARQLARLMQGDLVYRRVAGWTEFELSLPMVDDPALATAG